MFARCVCVLPMLLLAGCETSDVEALGSLAGQIVNEANEYNRQPQEYYRTPVYPSSNGGYTTNQAPVQTAQVPVQAAQVQGGSCYEVQSYKPQSPEPYLARQQYCAPQ